MNGIRLTTDLAEIDWTALRQALIEDDFHNGRTVEQYEASARASRLNVFAVRGRRSSGTPGCSPMASATPTSSTSGRGAT